MMRQIALVTIIALGVAGCGKGAKKDDVLVATNTPTVIAKTTQCTVPNADGVRCDRKTCKKDAGSDCAVFSDRCTQSGHTYEGNADSGTCIRGAHVG